MLFRKVKKTTIFYGTDIHGSETCFMKFVNAARFYKADVVIMGGDITGKMLIPIVEAGSGTYTCNFLGKNLTLRDEDHLQATTKQIRQTGYYPYMTTPDEIEEMRGDPLLVEQVFGRVMYEEMVRWVEIAEDRLRGAGVKVFVTPGNDDQFAIDQAFEQSDLIVNPEGKVVWIDDDHEMISTGFTNVTPWQCPRDIPEEELAEKIDEMTSRVQNMENCVFNFHCPPYNSQLDKAPKLNEDLRPEMGPDGPVMVPVGSHAVREAIEKYQPLLGLHGHIHESRGMAGIGRTRCVNPGSEYAEGYLRGALISLSKGRILSCQLTSG